MNSQGYLALSYHYFKLGGQDKFKRILGNDFGDFKKQVAVFRRNFQIISLVEAEDFLDNKKWKYKKCGLLITFDDGLSSHYEAAKWLAQEGIKGVFFIPTCILTDGLPANPIIVHYGLAIFGLEKFLQVYHQALNANGLSVGDYQVLFTRGMNNPWEVIEQIKKRVKYDLPYRNAREVLLFIYRNLLLKKYPDIMKEMHLTTGQIRNIAEMGHQLGSHTATHISVGASGLSAVDFYEEIIVSGRHLSAEFQVPVKTFSYPFGAAQDCASTEKLIRDSGAYKMAFTIEPILNTNKVSPWQLGRYMPTSTDTTRAITKKIISICKF